MSDAGTSRRRDRESGVPVGELEEAAHHGGDGPNLAGIWKCPHCDAQIQIIIEPAHEAVQPFTCICGAIMVAGEED